MTTVSRLNTYVGALFSGEPAGGLIEVRWREPWGMAQRFHPVERWRDMAAELEDRSRRTDVYVGVAPRRPYLRNGKQFGGREAIANVHALWADCDDPNSLEALADFQPQPPIVINSGHGRHAYWPLWPPVRPDQAERANRRLAHALGADTAAADAARVLRPPATINHKGAQPVAVTIERLEVEIFEADHVVGHLPDVAPPDDERPRHPLPPDPNDALMALAPAVYVEMLTGQVPDRDGKVACPFHEERTPSLHAYATAADGWYCFGCGRGGSIIDFGSLLYGIEARDAGFHEIRRRLLDDLLGAAA